jgi:ribA/ribD-fused uncharacterized protein
MDTTKNVIDRFTKQSGHEYLSNFYPSTIRFEGVLYPTVEHAYQASKTTDLKLREIIRKAPGPMEAKKLGKCLQLREDWENVRIDIMRCLIKEKFSNPFLSHLLIKTKDADLIMNNLWNDRFWGVCRGTGENWLGKILMEIREELSLEKEKEDIQFNLVV